ncbi:SCO2583 family membrane protein [Streptomyces pseudogriseolus]|uniref:SCO2583 family membrane protein n=1 Tax=Streptomyces pseudogriseolus TaxID=36817 RepID=UPI003FA2D6BF
MGEPSDPPEGTPEGAPGGGDDEYRSVVFDETFVRAARLQEFSAQERITDHTPAVRRLPPARRSGLSRQALVLVLLIAVAFGTAVYMGVRHPYRTPVAARPAEPLRMTVVPLAPEGAVPGARDVALLYAHSPAAGFRAGAEGVPLPPTRRTANFSDDQVVTALLTARDYVVRSALDPAVVTGGETRTVRVLLDSGQQEQFDESMHRPAADGRHAVTGWLVRFDPARVRLADPHIRVRGTLQAAEADSGTLEVTTDHTVVYALRPAGAGRDAEASLFTVRRELRFRFDREDLRLRQAELLVSHVQAGPQSCTQDPSPHLHPLLAGRRAPRTPPPGTNPYAPDTTTPALCGTLSEAAQPKL